MSGILGVVAILALTFLLLVVLVVEGRARWWLKIAVVIVCGGAIASSYRIVQGLLGWPVDAPLPNRFQLMGAFVEEPDKVAGTPGAVYLWVAEIDENNRPISAPRSFVTPLTETTAEHTEAAQQMLNAGTEVLGEMTEKKPEQSSGSEQAGTEQPGERTEEPEDGNRTIFSGLLGPLGEPAYINFLEMPSVELPPKE